MKTISKIIYGRLAVLGVAYLAMLAPKASGVVPPPDGGYPNFTTAEGQNALFSLTSGLANTAVGWFSLRSVTTSGFNTAVGAGTLLANIADENTAIGAGALLSNTNGPTNTATGAFALLDNSTGAGNTADGQRALENNTIGSGNTGIGRSALANNTTGNSNVGVGNLAGFGVTTANNVICIGADGQNVNDSCYVGNIFNQASIGGIPVLINQLNKLGTSPSSKRFKEQIKPMEKTSEALFALKPVTFRYKKDIDPAGTRQLGLVAEEVEKLNPDLVVRDKEGKPYSVRYDQVNAMLLNEFLKAHRKIEEQEKRIDELTAKLQDQAAQIQKVNARIEMNNSSAKMAGNP